MVFYLFIAICSAYASTTAGDQSMRALAKRHEGTVVENVVSEHFDRRTPLELLGSADTVLSGRIVEVTPHFSADERSIVTDYQIVPNRIVKRDPNLDFAVRPGSTRTLVVRRKGGTLIEDGVRYSTWLTGSSSADLSPGDEVVLFLSYDSGEKAYFFSGGPFGAYRVKSGEVVAMAREADERGEHSVGPLEAFVDSLQRSLNKKNP
jgi:hypothetical protein